MRKIGAGILIDEYKRVFLIKRNIRKKYIPNYWDLPGGGNENGENMEETAIREVGEEIGLIFSNLQLFSENEITALSEGITENFHFYRYIGKYAGVLKIEEKECDGYGWFLYKEMKSLQIPEHLLGVIEKLREKNLI